MTTSELIKILLSVEKTHGNMPVLIGDDILDPVIIEGSTITTTCAGQRIVMLCLNQAERSY